MYLALAGYRGEGKLVKDAVLQTERRLCYGSTVVNAIARCK
jgi:hypothetical protein